MIFAHWIGSELCSAFSFSELAIHCDLGQHDFIQETVEQQKLPHFRRYCVGVGGMVGQWHVGDTAEQERH